MIQRTAHGEGAGSLAGFRSIFRLLMSASMIEISDFLQRIQDLLARGAGSWQQSPDGADE
ncbi:hypothetical protein D3C83_283580 [compost metagenome]